MLLLYFFAASKEYLLCFLFFKYIPANQFKYVVKDVRRQRCREEEENVWASFVKQQELSNLAYNKNGMQPSVQSIKELLDEGMRGANKELERIEADTWSNEIKNEYGRIETGQRKSSKVKEFLIKITLQEYILNTSLKFI